MGAAWCSSVCNITVIAFGGAIFLYLFRRYQRYMAVNDVMGIQCTSWDKLQGNVLLPVCRTLFQVPCTLTHRRSPSTVASILNTTRLVATEVRECAVRSRETMCIKGQHGRVYRRISQSPLCTYWFTGRQRHHGNKQNPNTAEAFTPESRGRRLIDQVQSVEEAKPRLPFTRPG